MKRLLFISAICWCTSLNAQNNTSLTYPIGFGAGDLSDFIGKASFRGINLDFRQKVQPNLGVGFTLGWNVFYEEMPYGTYTVDNVSLTGKQYHYSNHVPMLVNAAYYLSPDETVNPFFGLGIGTIYTRRNTDMNLYTMEQEAWNFALQPEAGLIYAIDDATGITLSVKYSHGFKAGDLDLPQAYFSLNVGFVFMN